MKPTVCLQCHMDMVVQKDDDVSINFDTDPLVPRIVDGYLRATGTSLGADNGIGIAACFAILEDNSIKHGPLEVLVTRDEETGMYGATDLEPGILKASYMINVDSEEENAICIGCAGRLHRLDDAPSSPRAAARRHAPLAGAEQLRGRTHGRRHPPGPREPAARAGTAAERQSLRGATGLRGLRHRRQRHSPQVRGGGSGGRCGRGALHRGDGGRVRTLPQGVPAHRDEGFADNDNNGGDAAAGKRGGDAELRRVPGGVSVRGAALLAGGAGRGGDLDDLRYR